MWLGLGLSLILYCILVVTIWTASLFSDGRLYYLLGVTIVLLSYIGWQVWGCCRKKKRVVEKVIVQEPVVTTKLQRNRGDLSSSRQSSYNATSAYNEQETKELRHQIEIILQSPKAVAAAPVLEVPKHERKMSIRKPSTEMIKELE